MKNKFSLLIFAFVLIILFRFNAKADEIQSIRLYGLDRYETNEKIVQQGWQSSDYAIIVNGENFPDALSAVPLAKKYNAPIILSCNIVVDPRYSNLYPNTVNELKRLNVKKAFIIGGIGALSNSVESKINDMGISTERISGADRYETSIAIANKIGTSNGVIVTTGDDYADALSVAPIAGKLQIPIILSQKDSLESVQKNFISNNSISKTYILGDADIINDNVASKFPNVQRILGDTKYNRNLNIINAFSANIDFSNVILASGENFPDALSGSAFAALNGNPIFLVNNTMNQNFIANILNNKNTSALYTLGGTGSIGDNVINDLEKQISALNSIKSKVTLSPNLSLKIEYSKYNYDGSSYYVISLHEAINGLNLNNFYQYKFLVDIQTGNTYKLNVDSKEITSLDNMQIDNNNAKQKAVEAVANCITEKDDNTAIEYLGIENKDNKNYYHVHVYDDLYDHLSTIDWYYVDVDTNKIYLYDIISKTLTPIN